MAFRIRNATEAGIPVCAAILSEEFKKQGELWTSETANARMSELFENAPEICFCLELGNKVIGIMFCETFNHVKGKYLWIAEFAITAEHQGKGFGLKALQFIEKAARAKKIAVLYLAASLKEKPIKMYEKFGFKKTNWLFMEKEL